MTVSLLRKIKELVNILYNLIEIFKILALSGNLLAFYFLNY